MPSPQPSHLQILPGNEISLTRDEMVAGMHGGNPLADGQYIVAVRTTGIYCLPSCTPPTRPKPENVDFYPHPSAARSAGYRACKRCHPDDYYRGYLPEEALVEQLVTAISADPAGIDGVGGMATLASVGQSTLHTLVREHLHTTPADLLARMRVRHATRLLLQTDLPIATVALESGFASLSTFSTHMRDQTGMTPTGYRAMWTKQSGVLLLPDGYSVALMRSIMSRYANGLTARLDGDDYWGVVPVPGSNDPVAVQLTFGKDRIAVRYHRSAPVPADALAAVHERVVHLLGLPQDTHGFEEKAMANPPFGTLVAGQEGLRISVWTDPYDALIRTICGQQITVTLAAKMRARLLETYGTPIGHGLVAPPRPERMAVVQPDELTALGFSGAKAKAIIAASRAIASGNLPLGHLREGSAARADRLLRALPGVGVWTANDVLLRGMGYVDTVPFGDAALAAGLQILFGMDHRPDREEQAVLLAPLRPWRGLATIHLWQRYGASIRRNAAPIITLEETA